MAVAVELYCSFAGDNPDPTPTPTPAVRPSPDPLGSTDYKFIQRCFLVADGKQIFDVATGNNTKYDATLDFVRYKRQYGICASANTQS